MSRCLTVGSCTFAYPEQGTNPGWGEEATCWAVAVTNKLGTLSGATDIDLTQSCISCNQSTAANITNLLFSTAAVRSFIVDYHVTRTLTCVTTSESGQMHGNFNPDFGGPCVSGWNFSHEFTGCAGMDFQISASGQVQYFSDNTKGTGTIKFKAKTIAV